MVNSKDKKYLFLIGLLFILSRLMLNYCFNIRYDVSIITDCSPHLLDLDLLKHRLAESIFYLHMQPPMLNLFLGIGLKLFPQGYPALFHLIFFALGLIEALALFYLMIKLNISRAVSFLLVILFIIGPHSIVYEHWFFYTHPVAALLCLAGVFLYKFVCAWEKKYGLVFFSLLSIIILTRAVFHPVWFLFIVAVLVLSSRQRAKTIIITSFFPFLIVLLWFSKNYVLFDSFSSSTMLGMNMHKFAIRRLNKNIRSSLINQGVLSPLSELLSFNFLDNYMAYISKDNQKYKDIPVLSMERKLNPSRWAHYRPCGCNFNNFHYIEISNRYLRDSLRFIKKRPDLYLGRIVDALGNYFMPSVRFFVFYRLFVPQNNFEKIRSYSRYYNMVLLGSFKKVSYISLWTVLLYGVIFFYLCFFYLPRFRQINKTIDKPALIVYFFLIFTIFYVIAVANCFDFGENDRYSYLVAPFSLIMSAFFIGQIVKRLQYFIAKRKQE